MSLANIEKPVGTDELLVALGILTTNWNENRDSVGNFSPLVTQALKDTEADVVAVGDLQQAVERDFELRIPQGALNTILRRASREGYATIKHGVMYPNRTLLADFDLTGERADVERQLSALLIKLQEFALAEHRTDWSVEVAEQALRAYIATQATPLLATTVTGKSFQPDAPVKHFEVVVNHFVNFLCAKDLTGLKYLETFVKGSMLANALYLPEGFGSIKRHFSTDVYLDTRLALLAIGYAEDALAQPVRELVELLQRFDAKLHIFEHTLHEVEGILDKAAILLRTKGSRPYGGSVLEYFVKEGMKPADAERLILTVRSQLARVKIEVVQAPPPGKPLGIDENRLASALESAVPYARREALDHDIKSLTAVHRLRAGKPCTRLESCPAVFVTTNQDLVEASTRYFREVSDPEAIPVCMHDHTLTTVAWLKDPAGASDLPRKRMIADSFAAANPPRNLWRKYLEETERQRQRGSISKSDYIVLRYSMEARQALVNITCENGEVFTEGTVPEVLRRARENVAKEAQAKGRKAAAKAEAQGRETTLTAFEDRYRELSRTSASILAGGAFLLATAALVVGLFVTAGQFLPASWNKSAPALISACIAAAVLLTLAHAVTGFSLLDLTRRLRSVLAERIFRVMRRLFSPRAK